MRKLLLFALLLVCFNGDSASANQDDAEVLSPELPPARPIPGINVEDDHPNACVDCHKNNPEQNMDARFSTWIKDWQDGAPEELVEKAKKAAPKGMKIKGEHPKVKADLTTAKIPDNCLECHAERPKNKKKAGPPFARLVHLVHLTGGEDNHFMTYYQGQCTYCHKLDQDTGHWSLGSGTEAEVARKQKEKKKEEKK